MSTNTATSCPTCANESADERAAQQRDAADEGRLEPCGSTMVGTVIVNQGEVVRPSQLIASVRRA
jgi:hypothetical protein